VTDRAGTDLQRIFPHEHRQNDTEIDAGQPRGPRRRAGWFIKATSVPRGFRSVPHYVRYMLEPLLDALLQTRLGAVGEFAQTPVLELRRWESEARDEPKGDRADSDRQRIFAQELLKAPASAGSRRQHLARSRADVRRSIPYPFDSSFEAVCTPSEVSHESPF
jgi:hypothetical protein